MSLLLLDGIVLEGCEELDQLDCYQEPVEAPGEVQEPEQVTRNLYALIGNPNTRYLRLQGYIVGKPSSFN